MPGSEPDKCTVANSDTVACSAIGVVRASFAVAKRKSMDFIAARRESEYLSEMSAVEAVGL